MTHRKLALVILGVGLLSSAFALGSEEATLIRAAQNPIPRLSLSLDRVDRTAPTEATAYFKGSYSPADPNDEDNVIIQNKDKFSVTQPKPEFEFQLPLHDKLTEINLQVVNVRGEVQGEIFQISLNEPEPISTLPSEPKLRHWYATGTLSAEEIFQSSGGFFSTVYLAWNPSLPFNINENYRLRLNIGAGLLSSRSSGSSFIELNTEVFVAYERPKFWNFGIGGGVDTWISNGGVSPIVSGFAERKLDHPFLKHIDSLVVEFSEYLASDSASILRAGFRFGF
jgi:hypothetical protein